MARTVRLASTQISLAPLKSLDEYWQRLESLLDQARTAECQIVLLPEYACLSLLVHGYPAETPFQIRLQNYAEEGHKLFEAKLLELSQRFQLALVGGTYPVAIAHAKIINRCLIARPNAHSLVQDKLNMTRFETEEWRISAPHDLQLKIFDLAGVRTAVAICYDVEFPSVTAAAAEAGVELLLVPSCTDHVHGYWRVRHCAEARTIENQCFVAMASVVDGDDRFVEMDAHYGQAAIFSPCDGSFPARGLLAEGTANQEGIIWADLDLDQLHYIRQHGSVLNLRDQSTEAARKLQWLRV